MIEGFVTPSGLPTAARVGIGVIAELAFFAYVFVLGRQAVQRGATGDVDEPIPRGPGRHPGLSLATETWLTATGSTENANADACSPPKLAV